MGGPGVGCLGNRSECVAVLLFIHDSDENKSGNCRGVYEWIDICVYACIE